MSMKKILTIFIFAILPLIASADIIEISGIYYDLINKARTAEVTKNPNNYSGDVVIPPSVEYLGVTYNVTSIGSNAFAYSSDLNSITIPNGVISIGESAFAGCI